MTALSAAGITAAFCLSAGAFIAWMYRRSSTEAAQSAVREAQADTLKSARAHQRDAVQLASVLETMVEGVVALDGKGEVRVANSALAGMFAIDSQGAVGRPFVEVLRHPRLQKLAATVLRERSPRVEEIVLFSPAERVVEAHAVPLPAGETGTGALLVLHDITRLRRLEQVRREFVANVSHELRTPLTSIKGFAEVLRGGADKDPNDRAEFLETIERHADRLTRLVDDLLDLAAIESGKRQPMLESLSIKEAVEDSAAVVRPLAARRRVTFTLTGLDALPQVRADKGQLRQVLVNLLDNAVKFNREDGKVEVTGASDGKFVTIAVKDTGIGVPTEDLPRIFERFYRADKSRTDATGTGLGLSIVKHIVEGHGGMVGVDTSPAGSTFRFTLPLA